MGKLLFALTFVEKNWNQSIQNTDPETLAIIEMAINQVLPEFSFSQFPPTITWHELIFILFCELIIVLVVLFFVTLFEL